MNRLVVPARRVAFVAATLLAVGVPSVSAAPITRSASGHAVFGAIPTGGKVESASTSVDPGTGAWRTTVTFDAAQSARSASALRVALTQQKPVDAGATWTTDTDPTHLGQASASADFLQPTYNGVAPPAGALAFNADHTVLTLTVTDPKLVGTTPDVVHVSTAERAGGTEYSTADLFLGPTAPKTTIPARTRQLTASGGGTIHVPINALPTKADRRVTIKLNGQLLGLKSLPAKYSARREAVIRLSKTGLRRLGTTNRRVVLQVETRLDNGSHAYARRTVRLRRR
jgi:hypothetical protein